MAVYTEVAFAQAAALLHSLDLGDLTELRGIQGGIENTNYFVTSERDGATLEHVLTVFERLGFEQLPFYLHLMKHEGEGFTRAMIERGTLERLVPVLMTALSAGIALVPLVLAAGQPGKEILHPVAVVMVGGLVSTTLLDLVVTPAVFFLFGRKAAEKAIRLDAAASH